MSCKATLTKYSGNCRWMDKLFLIGENITPCFEILDDLLPSDITTFTPFGGMMYSSDGFLYLSASIDSDPVILRINPETMTVDSVSGVVDAASSQVDYLCESGDYIYFSESGGTNNKLYKYDRASLTEVTTTTAGMGFTWTTLCISGGFLFAGIRAGDGSGKLYKLTLDDLFVIEQVDGLALAPYPIAGDGSYVYASSFDGGSSDRFMHAYIISSLVAAPQSLEDTRIEQSFGTPFIDDGFLYIWGENILKISVPALTLEGVYNDGQYFGAGIRDDNGNGYFAVDNSPSNIVKVKLSDMSLVSGLDTPSLEFTEAGAFFGDRGYFVGYEPPEYPVKIVQLCIS